MIRSLVCLCVVAVLTWASARSAFAFEPITFTDIPDLVGKQVFAGVNIPLGPVWAYAGEPLTLVAAPPVKRGDTTIYEFVRVKTEDSKEVDVPLRFLSRTALRFNLRSPGTARQLVLALLADAFDLPAKMHEFQVKYQYNARSSAPPDEHSQLESLEESFKFEHTLLHNLVHGALVSKDQALRDGATKWLVAASDETILDWYCHGIPDKKLKAKLANAALALNALDDGVLHLDFVVGQLYKEKADKLWRRGLSDLPAEKLEKLDAENLARIDKEIEKHQKSTTKSFAEAKLDRAHAQ